ncbi:MAG: CGNR zinc finger domain-containing protein [bacterium]|nr:CGNR zinc finger domain-containing protein [bacterium]
MPWPPGISLPVPFVTSWAVEKEADGWLVLAGRTGQHEPPADLYLQEVADLATAKGSAVQDFVTTWGPLLIPPNDLVQLPQDLAGQLAPYRSQANQQVAERQARGEAIGPLELFHEDEVVMGAQVVRALTRQVEAAHSEYEDDGMIIDAWAQPLLPRPARASEAWDWFKACINCALKPFHSRVDIDPAAGETGGDYVIDSAYLVACVQVFNHLQSGLPYRTCANENCGRLFFTQRGRAKYGQNRTSGGVRYCSVNCGKAQWAREDRAKKAATSKKED